MAAHEVYIRQHLSKYRDKAYTKEALLSAIRTFPDLFPKEDTFVFSDLTEKSLLSLIGTIPVLYKGSSYNIPICIWLFETFPYNPPMCYVKPTQNMVIKPSRHVDSEGKVYLPYLHEWKHPNSDLIGLIQVMMVVFGENSPLYVRETPSPQDPFKPVELKQSVFSKQQLLKLQNCMAGSSSSETEKTVIANQPILKLQESTQSLNRSITSLNLRFAFVELRGGDGVPESLLDNCCQLQEAGGAEAINHLFAEVGKLAERNRQILFETVKELNSEALEYNEMKERFKEKWTRNCKSSDHLTNGFRAQEAKYQDVLKEAHQADALLLTKYDACRENITILSQSKIHPGVIQRSRYFAVVGDMEETIRREKGVIELKLRTIASHDSSRVTSGTISKGSITGSYMDALFKTHIQKVEEIIQKQKRLQATVKNLTSSFPAMPMTISTKMEKKNTLDSLQLAIDTYAPLTANLKEGFKFYSDLALLLVKFQSNVTDFCHARKREREELLRILTTSVEEQASSAISDDYLTYKEKTTEISSEYETLCLSRYVQMANGISEEGKVVKHEENFGELENKLQQTKVQSDMERSSPNFTSKQDMSSAGSKHTLNQDEIKERRAENTQVEKMGELSAEVVEQLILDNHNIFGVSQKPLMDYSKMFHHFDKEKRGKLDHQNLKSCLLGLGYNLPLVEEGQKEPEFEAILDAVDPNRDGFVSLQAYMFFMISQETDGISSRDEIEKAFQALTHKGKPLTKQELYPLHVKSDTPEGNSTDSEGNAGAKSPVLTEGDYSAQIKTMEEKMKRENEAWKDERQQMEKRIKEFAGEVKKLQEQLEQMKNHSESLEEESKAMKQKLESKNADLEVELHQTKHEKTSLQAEVERLQKELEEARKQLQVENGPGKGTTQDNSEDASPFSTEETGNLSSEDFGKFQYHLSSYLTQDIIRNLTLVLVFSPSESEEAVQDKFQFIRLLREKGLISPADITPLTKALVTIGRRGVCDTVKKLMQSNPSEE